MLALDLDRLARAGSLPVAGEVPPDAALWETTGLRMGEPVRVNAVAQWLTDEEILVRGRVSGVQTGVCRRCAEDVERPFELPLDLYYAPADAEEVDAADVRTYDPSASRLDLLEGLREEVLLGLDGYLLCRTECRGLCPQCGTDLNENECACAPVSGDARWDALRALAGRTDPPATE